MPAELPVVPTITVVLDIDGVLVVGKEKEADLYRDLGNKEFFADQNLIVEAATVWHCLQPATIPFLRALFAKPNVEIAFFSSGAKARNESLVPKLLDLALGVHHDKRPKIFSQDDLTNRRSPSVQATIPQDFYDFGGEWKKDLRKIVGEAGLAYTVLVEDDPSYAVPDQAKNVLKVPWLDTYHVRNCGTELTIDHVALGHRFVEVQRFNNLFYGMGMLCEMFDELEKAQGQKTVPEVLFELQYKGEKNDDRNSLTQGFYARAREKKFYERGLAYLKQYQNPEYPLEFLFPRTILNYKRASEPLVSVAGGGAFFQENKGSAISSGEVAADQLQVNADDKPKRAHLEFTA